MKTPKEWFEEELSGEPLTQESVIEIIRIAQLEAIEHACKVCAENADADVCFLGELAAEQIKSSEPFIEDQDYEVYVLKQSILNCIEILKKEIE